MITWTLLLILGAAGGTSGRAIDTSMSFPTEQSCKSASQAFLDIAPADSLALCVLRPSLDREGQPSKKAGNLHP
jgi:hypothetical protein